MYNELYSSIEPYKPQIDFNGIFIEKAKQLHHSTNLSYIKYLPMYARDYFEEEIQTDNLEALAESFIKALYVK